MLVIRDRLILQSLVYPIVPKLFEFLFIYSIYEGVGWRQSGSLVGSAKCHIADNKGKGKGKNNW